MRKQNVEIKKTIGDIHDVQHSINRVSETLVRTEAIADERLFKAASGQTSDVAYVKSYRQLKEIREFFDALVAAVQRAGKLENEQRLLQQRIRACKFASDLVRVEAKARPRKRKREEAPAS